MEQTNWLGQQFESNRGHLRGVAYRMLGSLSEADDAVQETWMRLSRSHAGGIQNLSGWLTTVVARVCLDMLRSRTARAEEPLEEQLAPVASESSMRDPEEETLLADSVGVALLVLLDRLNPAERLAFVLHDVFAVPFEEIAAIIDRTPEAARQLASRARRRVQAKEEDASANLAEQRKVVDAFLADLQSGDFEGLVAVLDPDVEVHIDAAAAGPGARREIRGAGNWAKGAVAFARMARFAQPALVDGSVGIVVARHGKLWRVLRLTIANGRIVQADIIAEPVGNRTASAGLCLHQHTVSGFAERCDAARHQADARFVIFDFFRDADDHCRGVLGDVLSADAGGVAVPVVDGTGGAATSDLDAVKRFGPRPKAISDSELIFPSGIRFCSAWKRFNASTESAPQAPFSSP